MTKAQEFVFDLNEEIEEGYDDILDFEDEKLTVEGVYHRVKEGAYCSLVD